MTDERNWAFAWQGLKVSVPAGWELASSSGTDKAGRVRLDDSQGPRLELVWSRRRRLDVDSACRTARRRLEKAAGKRKLRFEVQSITPGKLAVVRWRGDEEGLALVGWCPRCRRAVQGQVFSDARADELVRSLSLCSCESAEVPWSVYGLTFTTPRGWRLAGTLIRPGLIRLRFRKGLARLSVSRWAAADVLLGGGAVSEWYAAVRRELGMRGCPGKETEHRGHPAVRASCAPLRLRRTAVAWHCRGSRRLFAVTCHFASERIADLVAASVACCPSTQPDGSLE